MADNWRDTETEQPELEVLVKAILYPYGSDNNLIVAVRSARRTQVDLYASSLGTGPSWPSSSSPTIRWFDASTWFVIDTPYRWKPLTLEELFAHKAGLNG